MFTPSFLTYLAIGTLAMWIPIVMITRWYKIPAWKSIPITIVLTICGVLGTYLWYFVENLSLGGRSFYGAVFFVPVAFLVVAKMILVPYGRLMDLCAPAECVMLTIMKCLCLIEGCCAGIILKQNADGSVVRFPSQLAEITASIVIFVILLYLAQKEKHRGSLYPWYMLLYGLSRFALNFYRANQEVFAMGLTAGSFWSVFSVAISIAWLIAFYKKANKEK